MDINEAESQETANSRYLALSVRSYFACPRQHFDAAKEKNEMNVDCSINCVTKNIEMYESRLVDLPVFIWPGGKLFTVASSRSPVVKMRVGVSASSSDPSSNARSRQMFDAL